MNQQLVTYIKGELEKGISKEVIKQNLLSNGWNNSDIDSNFHTLENKSNPAPQKNMNSQVPTPPSNQNISSASSNSAPHYQPVGVPADQKPKSVGLVLGILGLISAGVSLVFIPPLFGILGIIFGVISLTQGNKVLGTITISLSVLFMILGIILVIWILKNDPDFLKNAAIFIPTALDIF